MSAEKTETSRAKIKVKMQNKLFIVATPIGNLEDITFRAIKILKNVDIIACEDTRHTKILLNAYNINKPLVSFYSYNQIKKTDYLITELKNGKNIALVSDAGMPGISDPGYVIIKEAIKNEINLEVIPGASALITALVASGKPTNKFVFEGFLSNKSSQRRKRLEELKKELRTVVIYESPHRLLKLIQDIIDIMGEDKEMVCAREMTKKYEEIIRCKAIKMLEIFSKNLPRGEFVIVI